MIGLSRAQPCGAAVGTPSWRRNCVFPVELADVLRLSVVNLLHEMFGRRRAFVRPKNRCDFRVDGFSSDAVEIDAGQGHDISHYARDDGYSCSKRDVCEDRQKASWCSDDVGLESSTSRDFVGSGFLFGRDKRSIGKVTCADGGIHVAIKRGRGGKTKIVPKKSVHPKRTGHSNREANKSDIDRAIGYQLRQLIHRQFACVEMDARPSFRKSAHLTLQDTGIRSRSNIANLDTSDFPASGPAANTFSPGILFEYMSCFRQKNLTGWGQRDRSLCSKKQAARQVSFNFLNLHCECRGGDVESFGRTSKMELFGQHDEVAKVSELHSSSPIIRLSLINSEISKNERNSGICETSFANDRRRTSMSGTVSRISVLAGTVLSVMTTGAWAADVPVKPYLTLDMARAVVAAAEAKASAEGWPGVIAVVDAAGLPILIERMDHAAVLAGVDLAPGKARTAAMFRRESGVLEGAINSQRPALVTAQGYVLLRGGVPLIVNGEVIGAIGVSADTPDHDEAIAKAGAGALPQ